MNSSEKLPFFSDPDKAKNTKKISDRPERRKNRLKSKKEKEREEKKLFFTYITEDCQWGGKPVAAFTMAVSPESAYHNLKIRYNTKRGNKLDIRVKMEPIKLYSEMTAEEKEDARRDKSFNNIHSLGQLAEGRELLVNSGKRKKYYILDSEKNTIQKLNKKQWKEIQPRLQKNKENSEEAGE